MDAHSQRARRMDAQLWSILPDEIYEVVMSFIPALRLSLPVPHICRCRAACRCWGIPIYTPYFRTLHRRNGSASTGGYIVGRIVRKSDIRPTYLTGWTILDLEAQRWYTFKHSERKLVGVNKHLLHAFVSADGGLVCEHVSRWRTGNVPREPAIITVYNPLARRGFTSLPAIPDQILVAGDPDPRSRIMTFVANELDNSFKVFLINQGIRPRRLRDAGDRTVVMAIYDSTAGRWRRAANPSFQDFVQRGVGYGGSSVMYRGLLYVLFTPYINASTLPICWLFTYNVVDDVWMDTGVEIESRVLRSGRAQLVVSDDRLFLAFSGGITYDEVSKSFGSTLGLYEVSLACRVVVEVFQTSVAEVLYVHLNVDVNQQVGEMVWDPESIKIFGVGKSVCAVSDKIGTPIVYSLESGLWSGLPPNPMHPLFPGCEVWYGRTMSLHLPSEEEEAVITRLVRR